MANENNIKSVNVTLNLQKRDLQSIQHIQNIHLTKDRDKQKNRRIKKYRNVNQIKIRQ